MSNEPLNRKRFFFGIIAGGVSVIPILYFDSLISKFNLEFLNIFKYIGEISFLNLGISLLSLLLFIVFVAFIFRSLFFNISEGFKGFLKLVLKNILTFISFVLLIVIFFSTLEFLSTYLQFLNNSLGDNSVYLNDLVFDNIKLILIYYLIIGLIEEASKHFQYLQSSFLYIDSVKKGVLYAVFIALGFSFIENILYLNSLYSEFGLSREIVTTYFMRSIFSVFVHVTTGAILAYYFTKAFLYYRYSNINFPFFKIFFIGILFSVLVHAVFDIALTFGFTLIIIFYFIFGYLYITNIFYND